jgi:hypothetical protein
MRIVQRVAIAALTSCIAVQSAQSQRLNPPSAQQSAQEAEKGPTTKEILTDAAIALAIIAASIAAYKAMGKPCACPEDTMSNGRKCGGNSAWSKPKGYKPLCRIEDVTLAMIINYRSKKAVPALK